MIEFLLGGWGSLMMVGGFIGIMLLILGAAYRRGRKAEAARRARVDAKAVAKRNEIEEAVSGRSLDENRRRLGKWSRG